MRRFWLVLLVLSWLGGAGAAAAQDASPAGVWVGEVSWSRGGALAPVSYVWTLAPDGRLSSGRLGRGENGAGTWGSRSEGRLSLKYENGVRYEGVVREGVYAGEAFRADGRALGTFSMRYEGPDLKE